VICWLARFDEKHRPCQGPTDRAHLVKQQTLRREGHSDLIDDPRTWVPACRFHHGIWDSYGAVVVPRDALPEAVEALMEQRGLGWALRRRFGQRRIDADATNAHPGTEHKGGAQART
jgi:hypothetical protein